MEYYENIKFHRLVLHWEGFSLISMPWILNYVGGFFFSIPLVAFILLGAMIVIGAIGISYFAARACVYFSQKFDEDKEE